MRLTTLRHYGSLSPADVSSDGNPLCIRLTDGSLNVRRRAGGASSCTRFAFKASHAVIQKCVWYGRVVVHRSPTPTNCFVQMITRRTPLDPTLTIFSSFGDDGMTSCCAPLHAAHSLRAVPILLVYVEPSLDAVPVDVLLYRPYVITEKLPHSTASCTTPHDPLVSYTGSVNQFLDEYLRAYLVSEHRHL